MSFTYGNGYFVHVLPKHGVVGPARGELLRHLALARGLVTVGLLAIAIAVETRMIIIYHVP